MVKSRDVVVFPELSKRGKNETLKSKWAKNHPPHYFQAIQMIIARLLGLGSNVDAFHNEIQEPRSIFLDNHEIIYKEDTFAEYSKGLP